MVAACCRLCYDQYLKPDRTLDEEKLQQSYRKRFDKELYEMMIMVDEMQTI